MIDGTRFLNWISIQLATNSNFGYISSIGFEFDKCKGCVLKNKAEKWYLTLDYDHFEYHQWINILKMSTENNR